MIRNILKSAELMVIKVGSKVLLEDSGRPHYARIAHLVEQIARLHQAGKKVVFVSSGAIGAGMEAMGLRKRPTNLPTLQAAAAIGQARLMHTYEGFFGRYDCKIAQILL